jgi:hypothetical protein
MVQMLCVAAEAVNSLKKAPTNSDRARRRQEEGKSPQSFTPPKRCLRLTMTDSPCRAKLLPSFLDKMTLKPATIAQK